MGDAQTKDARLDLRLSSDIKQLLQRAAALSGVDLSAFTLSAAIEKADEVLEKNHIREVSKRDQMRLLEILQETEPTEELRQAVKSYKTVTREKPRN